MAMMLLALLLFTAMGIFIKLSALHLPVMEVVFFRNSLAVILLLPLVWHAGLSSLRMKRPKLFIGRAAINAVGIFCGFTALTMIPLAENTALTFTSPIFVTIGAVIFLGEVIRFRRIVAIVVGFFGALVILRPGFTEISPGALLALGGALSIAMATLLVKTMTKSETSTAIVFWMVMMQTPITLIPASLVWEWPDAVSWAYLWSMAITGTLAHILFTRACALVEITSLQPLEFAKLPFSVVLAWLVFGEWPGIWVWVGGAIIFASTAYITRREAAARRSSKPNHGQAETRL